MSRLLFSCLITVFTIAWGSVASAQSPANDQFADRQVLSGSFPITAPGGSTTNATAEAGEPDHATQSDGNVASNSVWYLFEATESGTISVAVVDPTFDAVVAIYSGDTLNSLITEGYADRFLDGGETAVANVEAGVIYLIAVDGYSSTPGVADPGGEGSFTLVVDEVPVPANDNFANAIVLPASLPTLDAEGTTSGTSIEVGEPNHEPDEISPDFPPNVTSNSAWYLWTATVSGPVIASAGGPNLDAVIAVYTGVSVDALTRVGGADAFGPGGRESVAFTAMAGTTYAIAVDTYTADALPVLGDVFTVIISEAPSNDQFAQRLDLGGSLPVRGVDGSTIGATVEVSEPEHANVLSGNFSSSTVWFEWTAPESALVGVNVASDQADGVVAVYTGDTLTNLVETAVADRWGPLVAERAVFEAVAGTVYVIAVDSYADGSRESPNAGLFELDIYVVPPNDDFVDAEDLLDLALPQVRSGTTLNASSEFAAGEPDHAFSIGGNLSSNSVWYIWTATTDATVSVSISGYSFDGVLAVYSDLFVELGASDRVGDGVDEEVRLDVVAGQEIRIAVDVYSEDGSDAGGGPFTLELDFAGSEGPFDTWIAGYPTLSGEDATRSGNPSGDGVSNLLKCVLGLDPTLRLAEDPMRGNYPEQISFDGDPALQYTVEPGNLGTGASAIQHAGELSTDLSNWVDSAPTNVGGDTWVIIISLESVDARYGRLKVTDPAG
ncbi:MAG: hypothetical protein ACR2RV_12615 [Verrucomicrobiales bacterium]